MHTLKKAIGAMFRIFWSGLSFCREIAGNLIFLVLIILLVSILFYDRDKEVPDGSVLVLSLRGDIVEQKTETVFSSRFFGEATQEETLLKDVINVLDFAKSDDRIMALLLDLREMGGAGISTLQDIGAALKRFNTSGKKIFASGDIYDQRQYYLAAHADRLYLHSMGGIMLNGFGLYRSYFKSAIEKLLIQFHVFRVGTYKTALEPFIRDDMSVYAKEANLAWMNVLWDSYKTDVAEMRNITPDVIENYINNISENLAQVGGDTLQVALDHRLVDGLKTREEVREELIRLVGEDDDKRSFKQIAFDEYLAVIQPKLQKVHPDRKKIGIIVAKGIIMEGTQPAGKIGGDSLADLIRKARRDESIEALVLRIDSPGGSPFASETIRQEIELTRKLGKPVVVSMGSVAASGGYWIASAANEILAAPTTITGSIGIFGAFATFEKSLDSLGIHSDGVGTTRLADAFNPTRPLNPIVADVMEQTIKRRYQDFLERVAEGRNMPIQEVEKIAQGRVWAGKTALELGLVDNLGNLQDAVQSAARIAGLTDYDAIYVEPPLTAREKLLQRLNQFLVSQSKDIMMVRSAHPVVRYYDAISGEFARMLELNDPNGVYAYCMMCNVR